MSTNLTARSKPISRNQRIEFNRGEKISRNSPAVKDDVKNISISLMDIDSAILYYFDNVIKPEILVNNERVKVPCIYGSPERWNSIQKQGYLRDKKRQIIVPLIVFQRTGMSKNRERASNKIDANNPQLFYTFENKYSQHNRFDKFSVQEKNFPGKEYYNVVIPDYVTINYDFIVWTSYIEQMNKIVEKINYSNKSYWGESGKSRFRTTIQSFDDETEFDDERIIKTKFSISLDGYILPESYNNYNTTQKFLTPKKIIIREQTDKKLEDIIKP